LQHLLNVFRYDMDQGRHVRKVGNPDVVTYQQPSQQPEARRGLATINVWGDRFIIRHTGNQKYL